MGICRRKLLLPFLLIFILLTGCGSEKNAKEGTGSELTYNAQHNFFSIPGFVPYLSEFAGDGSLYIAGRKDDLGTQLFCVKEAGEEPERIPMEMRDGAWINSMEKGTDGRMILAYSQYTDTLKTMELITVSGGKITGITDVTNTFRDKPEFEAEHVLLSETGTYYVSSKKLLYAVNLKGELVFEVEAEVSIEDLILSKDGKKVLVILSGGLMKEMDEAAGCLRSVNNMTSFAGEKYVAGIEKDILYSRGNSLYTCNMKDKEPLTVLKWEECDLAPGDVQCFSPYTDGRISVFAVERHETGCLILHCLQKSREMSFRIKKY